MTCRDCPFNAYCWAGGPIFFCLRCNKAHVEITKDLGVDEFGVHRWVCKTHVFSCAHIEAGESNFQKVDSTQCPFCSPCNERDHSGITYWDDETGLREWLGSKKTKHPQEGDNLR